MLIDGRIGLTWIVFESQVCMDVWRESFLLYLGLLLDIWEPAKVLWDLTTEMYENKLSTWKKSVFVVGLKNSMV